MRASSLMLLNCHHLFVVLLLALVVSEVMANFEITVIHDNDIHAHFEQYDALRGECSSEESEAGLCFGGVARRKTMIDELRSQNENSLFLSGGDQFQGSLLFYFFQEEITIEFMELLGYDVMAVGNHEFDLDVEGLSNFVNGASFPVISANIDTTADTVFQGTLEGHVIFELSGEQVGVVGYTTEETPDLSMTGRCVFSSVIESVQATVDALLAQGITKIIAVGHAGIDVDVAVAEQVRGVDVVVGGHTNTFLYSGPGPSAETPYDEYPIVVHPSWSAAADGSRNATVLVVQDYAYGKYLGNLSVTFDDAGEVVAWAGNPILLDGSVAQNTTVQSRLEHYTQLLDGELDQPFAKSFVELQGQREVARQAESNLGNIITDAMVHNSLQYADETRWTGAELAIYNGGGIRAPLQAGDLTPGDIFTVLPFGGTFTVVQCNGSIIWDVLEHALSQYETGAGRFLQLSGIHQYWDPSRDPYDRLVDVWAVCGQCSVPTYTRLELNATYKMVVPSFLQNGGDGFHMLTTIPADDVHEYGDVDADVVISYLAAIAPIWPSVEGRINKVDKAAYEVYTGLSTADPCDTADSSDDDHHDDGSYHSTLWAIIGVVGLVAAVMFGGLYMGHRGEKRDKDFHVELRQSLASSNEGYGKI